MDQKYKFIAFDIGAESGRCVVALINHGRILLNEIYRFPTHNIKYENGFYWNILGIYKEIIAGLTKAKKDFGETFAGIGIDTWGVDYVLLDADDRLLGYPYHYRDDRTDNIMEEAFKVLKKEAVYRKTGTQHAQFNTLFQLLSENNRKNNLLKSAEKMVLIPDFLNFLLSGVKKSEYSIASTTGLINPVTRNWAWEVIDAYKLPRNIFPEIIEPGNMIGTLLPAVAQETGLNPDTPVFAVAGHDTASAVAAVPGCGEDWAFLSSGTWSLMGVELDAPLSNSEAMKYNFTNEGGIEGTTRFIKNILGLWPVQECRRYWEKNSQEYTYEELTNLAKENGFANAWIDLEDKRFFKAGAMPEKVISFLQETSQNINPQTGSIIHVILESLAFSYRSCIKQIEKITGKRINKLHVIGGGINNEYLMQLTADAINRTVIAGPAEGTVMGNIGVQAIASGIIPDRKIWRNMVLNSLDIKVYGPKNTAYFDKNEKNYSKILKSCNERSK